MTPRTVQFHLRCTAEDPQAPARVMGVFAARSLLPRRFQSLLDDAGVVGIEIEIRLEPDGPDPEHLARVLDRIPTVDQVRLVIDGHSVEFEANSTYE